MVTSGMIMAWAAGLVQDTIYTDRFKNGKISRGWYDGFLERNGFHTGVARPLETARAEWTTAANVRRWYDVFEAVLLDCGLAERTPEGKFRVTKPGRVASFDEMRIKMCAVRRGGQARQDRPHGQGQGPGPQGRAADRRGRRLDENPKRWTGQHEFCWRVHYG